MKRVLYAEDSVASQALMRRYLKDLCEVVVAPTPRAASALLGSEPFSAMITDYMFHEGDAAELIAQTRGSKSPTELPIVVVSSLMDKVLATRVLSAGANDVAAKPLHPVEFRALIQRMLDKPYIATPATRSVSLPTVQWQVGDAVHQYCPEFGLEVSGPTPEAAGRAMFSALKVKIAEGAAVGRAHHTRLLTHVIEY